MTAERRQPQRTCLGCREVHVQDKLVRFVRSPDGALLIDYRGRLPGRGAYTCLKAACIRQAVVRKQFERALRLSAPAPPPEQLLAALAEAVAERLLGLLGMARKSSQVLSGSNQVLDALDHPERLAVVILADDVSGGIAEKVGGKARGRAVPCLVYSDKATLGQALGRGERSVTALLKGRLAETFLAEWRKYQEISGVS